MTFYALWYPRIKRGRKGTRDNETIRHSDLADNKISAETSRCLSVPLSLCPARSHADTKKTDDLKVVCSCNLSGYQDSNLGPPAPKAGALTGLRYIPKTSYVYGVQRYSKKSYPPNFFRTFFKKNAFFLFFS